MLRTVTDCFTRRHAQSNDCLIVRQLWPPAVLTINYSIR
jgi:hypothetical protein